MRSDKRAHLIFVFFLWESSSRWNKTVGPYLSFLFHPAERFTRAVPLPSSAEVLWNIWSTHWYLLLYSIIITSKNRNCCQEIDANNFYIFNKISNIIAFFNYLFIALREGLICGRKLYSHIQMSFTRLFLKSPASWYLSTFSSWCPPKDEFHFLKSLRKVCSVF